MLKSPKKFFDLARAGVMRDDGGLDQGEVDGCNAIMDTTIDWPISWVAYALATAWHETAHTMKPIKEYGGDRYFFRMYDKQGNRPHVAEELGNTEPGDGVKFAGRGYVMITGRRNYARASKLVKVDLLNLPDMAMDPDVAAEILEDGMEKGWFTGTALSHYLPEHGTATREEFRKARRIINGTDKDRLIAGYAIQFQACLEAGEWVAGRATA